MEIAETVVDCRFARCRLCAAGCGRGNTPLFGFFVWVGLHVCEYAEDFAVWVVILGNEYTDNTQRKATIERINIFAAMRGRFEII